jgi:hypothetical protein
MVNYLNIERQITMALANEVSPNHFLFPKRLDFSKDAEGLRQVLLSLLAH